MDLRPVLQLRKTGRVAGMAVRCSIQRTLDIVGEKWTFLVLREAFNGVRRFDDFQARLGCARNVLSARLATLVDHGVLARAPYREEGSRTRVEYRLTEKGRDLFPVLLALMQWGDRWEARNGGPVEVRHVDCDARVRVALLCEAGDGPLAMDELYPVRRARVAR